MKTSNQLQLRLRRTRSSVRTEVNTGGCGNTKLPTTDSRTTQASNPPNGKGYGQDKA
ncbi:MAG: hypothetical protein U0174_24370 [Polyangiaceae bacterium]